MKTTNKVISKKLAEIGFKPKNEESRVWNYDGQIRWEYPAYEFETLFEALPKTYDKGDLKIWYYEDGVFILYQDREGFVKKSIKKQKNESLADTAGRLLIKLYEAGIINFKK